MSLVSEDSIHLSYKSGEREVFRSIANRASSSLEDAITTPVQDVPTHEPLVQYNEASVRGVKRHSFVILPCSRPATHTNRIASRGHEISRQLRVERGNSTRPDRHRSTLGERGAF